MHCKHQSVTVGQIQIKYQCQIAQLKEHLTGDSGGLGLNPDLVRHYIAHPCYNPIISIAEMHQNLSSSFVLEV